MQNPGMGFRTGGADFFNHGRCLSKASQGLLLHMINKSLGIHTDLEMLHYLDTLANIYPFDASPIPASNTFSNWWLG